ncbi:CLUMA_CG002920, isoform A [Clunio marinus]|uniref:CLUMA_CG002920, isoform A n=1 Tax=Clunio marinus TaxID=568069 RepID=A0A1J1HM75_9DIPT|nr:CLUMA_CG002920, isoform A [Clunio marinus]
MDFFIVKSSYEYNVQDYLNKYLKTPLTSTELLMMKLKEQILEGDKIYRLLKICLPLFHYVKRKEELLSFNEMKALKALTSE